MAVLHLLQVFLVISNYVVCYVFKLYIALNLHHLSSSLYHIFQHVLETYGLQYHVVSSQNFLHETC